MLHWHCASVNVVAGSGYCILLVIVVCIHSHTSRLGRWQVLILPVQFFTLSRKNVTLAMLFPSGANLTPRVCRASSIPNRSKIFTVPVQSRICMSAAKSAIFLYLQFPLSHTKSIKYQCHFSGTIAPPVARNPPSHADNAFCIWSAMSWKL
jgi:hypothetical protein